MDKADLKKLLELKLPVQPTIDEMAFHIRQQQKLISYLVTTLVTQGAAIIRNDKAIVEIQGDLLLHGVPRQEEEQSSIIMPKHDIVRSN